MFSGANFLLNIVASALKSCIKWKWENIHNQLCIALLKIPPCVTSIYVMTLTLAISRVHNFTNSRFHEFWILFAVEHFDVCLTNPRDGRKCLCSTELCNLGIQTSPNKNNLATQMFFSLLMLPWLSWNLFLWPFCDYLLIKLYLYYSMYYLKTTKKRKEIRKYKNFIKAEQFHFISRNLFFKKRLF